MMITAHRDHRRGNRSRNRTGTQPQQSAAQADHDNGATADEAETIHDTETVHDNLLCLQSISGRP